EERVADSRSQLDRRENVNHALPRGCRSEVLQATTSRDSFERALRDEELPRRMALGPCARIVEELRCAILEPLPRREDERQRDDRDRDGHPAERASRDEPDGYACEPERLGERSTEDNQRQKILEAGLRQLAVLELLRRDARGGAGKDSAPQDRPRAHQADPDGAEKREKRPAR